MVRSTQRTTFALIISVLFLFTRAAIAATVLTDIKFAEYTIEDGISEDIIMSIVEDSDGYIWVGSIEGLFRYDGYHFKEYTHVPNNPNSIPQGFARTMFVSEQGELWLGTYEGLAKYRPETDDFQVYDNNNSPSSD